MPGDLAAQIGDEVLTLAPFDAEQFASAATVRYPKTAYHALFRLQSDAQCIWVDRWSSALGAGDLELQAQIVVEVSAFADAVERAGEPPMADLVRELADVMTRSETDLVGATFDCRR